MSEQNVQPARWLADPSGRHELRYWDGTRWTVHVSDNGAISVDDPAGPGGAVAGAAATSVPSPAPDLDDDAPTAAFDPFADEPVAVTVAMPVGAGVGAGLGSGTATSGPMTSGLGTRVGYVVPGGILPGAPDAAEANLGTLFGPGDLRLDEVQTRRPPADPGLRNRVPLLAGGLVVCAVVGTIAGIVAFSGLPDGGTDAVRAVASPTQSAEITADPEDTVDPATDDSTIPGPSISSVDAQPTDPMGEPTLEPPPLTPSASATKPPKPKPSPTKPSPTAMPPTPAPTQVQRYQSCQSMRRDYPNGVGLPGAQDEGSRKPTKDFVVDPVLYSRNAWLDRDSDGIVCEPKA